MAKVRQRTWTVPGQRTKRKAWGFVTVENGKHRGKCPGAPCGGCQQVRQTKADWSREDAENALASYLLKVEDSTKQASVGLTLAEAAERYLASKARKRTLPEDRRVLEHLKTAFGAETPLTAVTSSRISEYKAGRLNGTSTRTKRPLTAAGINRPLATLRHLLKIAHEEWEVLSVVPKVRLEREPQGRIRWLEPDEEARLLAACAKSQNRSLLALVTVAMDSGLRRGELLALTWDRVDLSRGVVRLGGVNK